jgi:hypothetical protein
LPELMGLSQHPHPHVVNIFQPNTHRATPVRVRVLRF